MRSGNRLIPAILIFLVILILLQVFIPKRTEGFEGTPADYTTTGSFCVSDSQCGSRNCNHKMKKCV